MLDFVTTSGNEAGILARYIYMPSHSCDSTTIALYIVVITGKTVQALSSRGILNTSRHFAAYSSCFFETNFVTWRKNEPANKLVVINRTLSRDRCIRNGSCCCPSTSRRQQRRLRQSQRSRPAVTISADSACAHAEPRKERYNKAAQQQR